MIVKTGGKVRVLVKVVIFLQLLLDYVLLVISIVDDAVWKNYDPTPSQWRLLLVPLGSYLRPYVHIKLLLIKFHLISWAHDRCSLAHDMIPNRQIPPNRDLIREWTELFGHLLLVIVQIQLRGRSHLWTLSRPVGLAPRFRLFVWRASRANSTLRYSNAWVAFLSRNHDHWHIKLGPTCIVAFLALEKHIYLLLLLLWVWH